MWSCGSSISTEMLCISSLSSSFSWISIRIFSALSRRPYRWARFTASSRNKVRFTPDKADASLSHRSTAWDRRSCFRSGLPGMLSWRLMMSSRIHGSWNVRFACYKSLSAK